MKYPRHVPAAVWGPAACAVLLLILIVTSMYQYACYPWEDTVRVEKLTCYNSTGSPNARWKVQTISEMTARSGLTAELLSGLAAISLISIYHTLCYLKGRCSSRETWHIIDATFAVGALGFVGLTVWNLRVESTVHTCFTSQTIMAVFLQVTVLTWGCCALRPGRSRIIQIAMWAVILLSMLWYVIMLSANGAPDPGPHYFDGKYYYHAYGQFVFFITYYTYLSYVAHCQSGLPAKKAKYEQLQDTTTAQPAEMFSTIKL